MRRFRVARSAREVLLTLGAVLGATCLLLGLVAVTAGVHVLVFRSGSMAPAIDTGDLALTRTVSAAELRADDVVSVIDSGGSRVTHRVVDVAGPRAQRQLTLRGDANEQSDREVYTVSDVQRVVLVIPKAGYLVAWSTGPIGLVLLGGYGAFLLSVLLRRRDDSDDDPQSPPRSRARGHRRAPRSARRGMPALLAVVLGGAMATVPTQAWAMPWIDPVTVTTGTFKAATVPPPATFTCSGLGLGSVRFTWSAVAGATRYRLYYNGGAASAVYTGTTADLGGLLSGGTAWITTEVNYGVSTWVSGPSAKRSYTFLLVSLCS
jgi:signal peptidase I